MYNPVSTYRIQFNKEFTFKQFSQIIPYLHKLGVGTLYAAPVAQAMPGSTHGYDVTDSNVINAEIGTQEEMEAICLRLKDMGIGWLQDIVPNHMAYSISNAWVRDMLLKGKGSEYSDYFDVDWSHPASEGRIMLPILGKPLDAAIADGDITIVKQNGEYGVKLYNDVYPLAIPAGIEVDPDKINEPSALKQILDQQHYELCEWQTTNTRINYRRFFTINGMICLNVQQDKVFTAYHKLVKELLDKGLIQGIRIDHIDGLYDPTTYLHRLRTTAGDDIYITVEKILEPGEELPNYWPVQGTTGYDFISLANNLYTVPGSVNQFTRIYNEIAGKVKPAKELYEKKALILEHYMKGELDNLYELFQLIHPGNNALPEEMVKRTLALLLVHCEVYRYYSNRLPVDIAEQKKLQALFDVILKKDEQLAPVVAFLRKAWLGKGNEAAAHLFRRCMQFSGPLMAKGVEDTLMYTYNRSLGHNEVGSSPVVEETTTWQFHTAILNRMEQWPLTMNTTATHDTKRGEDARARLLALTAMPEEWATQVRQWQSMNASYKLANAPDDNDEYLVYQALIASYPMPGQPTDDFQERFQAYIQKALREAKTHTEWSAPDEAYENGVANFIEHILADGSEFMRSLQSFCQVVADAGIIISLSQLALKCTVPGIPDVYQGGELWDLSMVDPDNRRPVDYTLREQWLNELEQSASDDMYQRLWDERYNGKIKLWLLHKLLQARKLDHELFAKGRYIPLTVTGSFKDKVIAYCRNYEETWYIFILPLSMPETGKACCNWGDTTVLLTDEITARLEHAVTGNMKHIKGAIKIDDVFDKIPLAVLRFTTAAKKRAAGVLLPVFSLPGAYGLGDFGTGAMAFVDFLHNARQRYWQILPLNPVDASNMYSPYSSASSMACNHLLISAEQLAKDGLITDKEILQNAVPQENEVNYGHAEIAKTELLDRAYDTYCNHTFLELQYAYDDFRSKEVYWLGDYALYVVLKRKYNGLPWYDWPSEYKLRDARALEALQAEHAQELEKIKWIQFITARQWAQLKQYCNSKRVQIIGDLPFYVSYDSVDVWANPEMFTLDDAAKMTGVAGVPPDYFSEDGQLWGVPTYNWNRIKETNYKWWVERLRKNAELFDKVRIDHFRALESYWEVAAGQPTAREGKWIKGPGMEFFREIEAQLGSLPFIAEDLGYEMEEVYKLREESALPGMKVLQFAWGDNMSTSVDIPHNYPLNCIVYTGTHDNNTTASWYKHETKPEDRQRINEYTGRVVNEDNVVAVMSSMAYASVAETVILPMQDILGLDATARMNTPGTIDNNWKWRLPANALNAHIAKYLVKLTELYNRA